MPSSNSKPQIRAPEPDGQEHPLLAVFDARYAYDLWRPVTAIRNGAFDGHETIAPDPTWESFIAMQMHTEYPCAHCVQAAALAGEAVPSLSSAGQTAPRRVRRWSTIEEFIAEVQLARIYDGAHYRNLADVGSAMVRKLGALVAAKVLR